MDIQLIPIFFDIAIGLGTVAGILATGWLAFRKRICAWFAPYKAAFAGMAELPEIRAGIAEMRQEMQLIVSGHRVMMDANDSVATFETDPTGRTTAVNATYARWLNVSKENLLGWGFINYVYPADRDHLREELELARHEARSFRIEIRMVTSAGHVFWIEKSGTPIPETGETVKWVGTVRKIDDRPVA